MAGTMSAMVRGWPRRRRSTPNPIRASEGNALARYALFTNAPQIDAVNAYSSAAAIARVRTFAFAGIEAVPVEVQVQISPGVPAFLIVGLPDKAVGEARERVRAAFAAMGLSLPPKRVLNTSPPPTC